MAKWSALSSPISIFQNAFDIGFIIGSRRYLWEPIIDGVSPSPQEATNQASVYSNVFAVDLVVMRAILWNKGCESHSVVRALLERSEWIAYVRSEDRSRNEMAKRGSRKPRRQTSRPRLLSEALRTGLAEVKSDQPAGRTYAEIVAQNLIEIACSEGPGAVHAAERNRTTCDFSAVVLSRDPYLNVNR